MVLGLFGLSKAEDALNLDNGSGVNVAADPYKDVREPLVNWLKGQVGQSGPKYDGQKVAQASTQENKSLDFLNQYGQQGLGQTFQSGQNQINNTLNGNYNPANSPYYQAVKAESARNLKDTQANIASNAGGGGRYFSGARVKQQGEAATDNANNLNTLLGQLSQQERQNQLNVLPQALAYGQAEQQLPLQQASAFQSLGALPRQLEQAGIDANLQEFLRSEYEYPLQIAGLAGQTQQAPLYQQNIPSLLYQLLPELVSAGAGAVKASAGGA